MRWERGAFQELAGEVSILTSTEAALPDSAYFCSPALYSISLELLSKPRGYKDTQPNSGEEVEWI